MKWYVQYDSSDGEAIVHKKKMRNYMEYFSTEI